MRAILLIVLLSVFSVNCQDPPIIQRMLRNATHGPPPEPTDGPAPEPTDGPAPEPTDGPAPEPTDGPAPEPTDGPAPEPTDGPAPEPTDGPAPEPTDDGPEPTHPPPSREGCKACRKFLRKVRRGLKKGDLNENSTPEDVCKFAAPEDHVEDCIKHLGEHAEDMPNFEELKQKGAIRALCQKHGHCKERKHKKNHGE